MPVSWKTVLALLALTFLAPLSHASTSDKPLDQAITGEGFVLHLDETSSGSVQVDGDVLVVTMPPAYSLAQTNHTFMDSMQRFGLGSQKVLGGINQRYLSEISACDWHRHQEAPLFKEKGMAMVECALPVTERFYQRNAAATRALMATLERGYQGRNYLPKHLHQNMAFMHLALADAEDMKQQAVDYIKVHKLLADNLQRFPAKVDAGTPLGFRFESDRIQSLMEEIVLDARRNLPDPMAFQARQERRAGCLLGP